MPNTGSLANEDSARGELQALTAALERASSNAGMRKSESLALEEWERKRTAEDRSNLTRKIVTFYFCCITFFASSITVRAYLNGTYTDYFMNLFDLLKVAVLPIVTFVLGYYFSRK